MSDFINKPNLEDCSTNTLIKYIPSIINNNNNEIKRVFNEIFEFGNSNNKSQYIKVPVNTSGLVRGNTGYFNNLQITNSLILDSSVLENSFQNAIINHQKTSNRFVNTYTNNITNNYAHDAESIFYKNGSIIDMLDSVYDALNNIQNTSQAINNLDASVKEIYSMLAIITNKLNINNTYNKETNNENESIMNSNDNLVEAINSPTTSYTYSSDFYKNNY